MRPISPATTKPEAREYFRSARLAMSETERNDASAGLQQQVLRWLAADHLPGDRSPGEGGLVAAYLSSGPEPRTVELLENLVQEGYHVVVPICEPDYQLSWCSWRRGIELHRSSRAPLLEPAGQRHHFTDLLDVHGAFDLVLVPGLAVDHSGSRLGQGGGYYDRFLAQLMKVSPRVPTAAYVYDHELRPAGTLATTPLDMPLAGAFTRSAFQRLGADHSPV